MKKLILTTLVVLFAATCAHKNKPVEAPATPEPTTTKDQAPPAKGKKGKKANAASTAATGAAASVKCVHNSDERILEVKDKNGGCETVYTKMGESKAIANANHGMQHCQDVSAKIQKNLTGAGFTCQ